MDKFSKLIESASTKPIKLGLDLHGVVSDMPEFFSFLTNILIKAGCEVHLITGGMSPEDEETLKKYGVRYTHYFSIVDYHTEKQTPTYGKHPVYGFDMISDEEWDKTKGDYCREHNIDLHIDDTLMYNKFFTTPFCRFWSHNNHNKPINKDPRHLG